MMESANNDQHSVAERFKDNTEEDGDEADEEEEEEEEAAAESDWGELMVFVVNFSKWLWLWFGNDWCQLGENMEM